VDDTKGNNQFIIMISRTIFLIVLIFVSCNNIDKVSLSLPPIFSDHMVLQQKEEILFWGNSEPNSKITIDGSWGESSTTNSNDEGVWSLNLKTPGAGGPFDVLISSEAKSLIKKEEKIIFKDILIGEVWLASGQSNMEWRLNQCDDCIDNQEDEIKNANYNDIRMFNVPQDLWGDAIKRQKWEITTSENVEDFSATAYFFARKLNKELKIPVGIINSSWGGTRVEAWTSMKKLKSLSPTKEKKDVIESDNQLSKKMSKKYNDSIALVNDNRFGFKTVKLPDWTEDEEDWGLVQKNWADLDLNDNDYADIDFDDSSWDYWSSRYNTARTKGSFEAFFKAEDELLSDGVIWFRTKVLIDDLTSDYTLFIDEGIDDSDQTFFNGELIGNTFSWNRDRNYKIRKEILKKGENTIAIRVTDLGGPGGFGGPITLRNNSSTQVIPFEKFKFKHHAFLTARALIVVHGYTDKELVQKSPMLNQELLKGIDTNSPNAYSLLFQRMLSPVMPFGIKGAIWYQGESNVSNYNEYQELFSGMIEDWRENWGYNFPFYYAQIAPYIYDKNAFSQGLRDAQRKTLESTEKTGMAVLMDIGEEKDIHPHNKKDVGERLALLALDKDYDYDIVSMGPLYKSHKNYRNYIEVDFTEKGSGLISKGNLNGFEIAGENGVYHKAYAKISDNKVIVSSKKVINPKHVRYGWKNWIVGTLFNKEGLPASSFTSSK